MGIPLLFRLRYVFIFIFFAALKSSPQTTSLYVFWPNVWEAVRDGMQPNDSEYTELLNSAWSNAINSGDVYFAEYLMRLGVNMVQDIETFDEAGNSDEKFLGYTALHVAVRKKNRPMVELLLSVSAGAKKKLMETVDQGGDNALHTAVCCHNSEMVKLLLSHGADVNELQGMLWLGRGGISCAPLHLAASDKKCIEIIKILLEHKAMIDVTDRAGFTPLHLAAQRNNVEAVELLLRNGADLSIKNFGGDTPSQVANSEEVKKMLLLAEKRKKLKRPRDVF